MLKENIKNYDLEELKELFKSKHLFPFIIFDTIKTAVIVKNYG